MSEREPQSVEHLNNAAAELSELAAEQRPEAKAEQPEKQQEKAERARETIRKTETAETAEQPAFEEHAPAEPKARHLDRHTSYRHTLASLRRHLSPASRRFSQLIHNPIVDKTSELVGNTVMRPSVTLGATATALVAGGFVYFAARHYGYALHGSEILFALLVGGILGAVIEALTKLVRR